MTASKSISDTRNMQHIKSVTRNMRHIESVTRNIRHSGLWSTNSARFDANSQPAPSHCPLRTSFALTGNSHLFPFGSAGTAPSALTHRQSRTATRRGTRPFVPRTDSPRVSNQAAAGQFPRQRDVKLKLSFHLRPFTRQPSHSGDWLDPGGNAAVNFRPRRRMCASSL